MLFLFVEMCFVVSDVLGRAGGKVGTNGFNVQIFIFGHHAPVNFYKIFLILLLYTVLK